MAQLQTVIVVVSKEWVDTGVRYLLSNGNTSRSTTASHILFGDLDDSSDHRGLWLKNVKTTSLTADSSIVKMKLMIPWAFVFAFAIVDDGEKPPPGFPSEGVQVWDGPGGAERDQ